VAEKMGLPQVTYAEEIVQVKESSLVVRRRLDRGVETVECPIPAVLTVNSSAPEIRPQNARLVMKYKWAMIPSEVATASEVAQRLVEERDYLRIVEMTAADIVCDEQQLGLSGSPTKVKKIENVVFQSKEAKCLTASDEDIASLMVELIASHTLG
jgi:electron transfer flavoprotein beta subunit